MKILHINTNDTGGAAIAAIRLHYLLLDNGFDSKILFLTRKNQSNIREAYYYEDSIGSIFLFRIKKLLNSLYNRRNTFFKPKIYFNGPSSLFNFSNHQLFKDADLIHLHWVIKFLNWKDVFQTGKKFVWTLHDMNPFTGGEHYKTGYNNDFPKISLENIRNKKKYIQNVDLKIVCPSEWLTNIAMASDVFKDKIVITIRNPIDSKIFRIQNCEEIKLSMGIPINKRVVLFVSENPNDPRKGLNFLLNSIFHLSKTEDIHFLIIGKNIPSGFETIDSTLLGYIGDEDTLSKMYNLADLFVIPSIEDNSPNTLSEALLCGTPVVGFRSGGIEEFILSGKNGFLARDGKELDSIIVKGIKTKFNRTEIREMALSIIDNNKILSQMKSLYTN